MSEGQSGIVILGDKGYVGENLTKEMSEQGICLMALKRSNSKADWTKPVRQLIFQLRRYVETVFFMKPVNLEESNNLFSEI
ncbi:Uncharacterised protein [uncultured Blautia sp.]